MTATGKQVLAVMLAAAAASNFWPAARLFGRLFGLDWAVWRLVWPTQSCLVGFLGCLAARLAQTELFGRLFGRRERERHDVIIGARTGGVERFLFLNVFYFVGGGGGGARVFAFFGHPTRASSSSSFLSRASIVVSWHLTSSYRACVVDSGIIPSLFYEMHI